MAFLLISFLCFLFFIALHTTAFRMRLMKFQTAALAFLSVIGAMPYLLFILKIHPPGTSLPLSGLLIYSLLCLWYLAECTVLQTGSPSMLILGLIQNHPEKCISHAELKKVFVDDKFLLPRIQDLVDHGFLSVKDHHYVLHPRGSWVARLILLHRRLLRRGIGG